MTKFTLESLPYRGLVFAAFSAFVLLNSLFEIIGEFGDGERLPAMLDDLAIFVLSLVVLVLFFWDYIRQQKSLRELNAQLKSVRGKLDSDSRSVANQYRDVIKNQFTQWKLTPSEQEVALTLIKGLSFREVAQVRQTQEKTVRQQAASVYKKAGLSGRHELAGWFFEDLLDPDSTVESGPQPKPGL